MKRTLVIVAVVALVALVGGYLLGRAGDVVSVPAATAPQLGGGGDSTVTAKVVKQSNKARRSKKERAADTTPAVQGGSVGAVRAETSALPPADTPLADIRDDLERRARAGDERAACRLGHELMRCQEMHERTIMLRDVDERLASAPREVVDRNLEFVARAENAIERSRTVCAGIPMDDTLAGFDWLAESAERGNVAAMATFARKPQLPFGSWIAELDRLEVYRDRAPRYAQQAFDAGDPRVLGVMAMAHADPQHIGGRMLMGNPLRQLLPTDDVRAYAYALLVMRYFPVPESRRREPSESARVEPLIARLEQSLSAEQQADARALANQLADTTFRTAQPRPATPQGEPEPGTFGCEE